MASHNQFFPRAFFEFLLETVGDQLEMMSRLIRGAPFGVSCVVTVEPVVAAAGLFVNKAIALGQFIESQVEESSALSIHKDEAQPGMGSQERSQRLKVKPSIYSDLGLANLRRKIKLPPEVHCAAGEHGLGAVLAGADLGGSVQDPFQIISSTAFFAVLLDFAHSISYQFFNLDGFTAMRFILRSTWLKVKA